MAMNVKQKRRELRLGRKGNVSNPSLLESKKENILMEKDILDNDLTFKGENEFQPKLINWTSIIILWIGIAYSIFNGLISDTQDIAAIILLAIATIISYLNFNIGVRITLGIILAGVVNLVNFFPHRYELYFAINGFEIGFELILFMIGLIHCLTNRKNLSSLIEVLKNRDVSEEEIELAKRPRINGFKNRYSNKDISELREIANNKNLVPQANRAARELLEEKNKD
jgi:hypothetical protein